MTMKTEIGVLLVILAAMVGLGHEVATSGLHVEHVGLMVLLGVIGGGIIYTNHEESL